MKIEINVEDEWDKLYSDLEIAVEEELKEQEPTPSSIVDELFKALNNYGVMIY